MQVLRIVRCQGEERQVSVVNLDTYNEPEDEYELGELAYDLANVFTGFWPHTIAQALELDGAEIRFEVSLHEVEANMSEVMSV